MLDDEIVEIVATISETMFGNEPLVRVAARPSFGEGALTGSIEYSGAFSGVLSATFSASLARVLATAMMQNSETSAADVRDAVGEVVNIVAGNIKPLLTTPCQFSLPLVQVGDRPPAGSSHERLGSASLLLYGEPMWVQLTRRARPSAPL